MNQNFANEEEYERFKWACAKLRHHARNHPAQHETDLYSLGYNLSVGPWSLRLTLEKFHHNAIYRASASCLEVVGEQGIISPEGRHIFDVDRQKMLAIKDWPADTYSNAKELLGDLMGPLINRDDQPVTEQRGLFALHWITLMKDAHKAAN